MHKTRLYIFMCCGQCNPDLIPLIISSSPPPKVSLCAMPRPCGHRINIARSDDFHSRDYLYARSGQKEIGHRGESNMRVSGYFNRRFTHLCRSQMIPENEGANHAFLCARQASPNSKIRANLTLFRCNDGCAAHEIACICCHSEWHLNLGFFSLLYKLWSIGCVPLSDCHRTPWKLLSCRLRHRK